MAIKIDVNKRIEWLKRRIPMDNLAEEYIRFQMEGLVYEAINEVDPTADVTIKKKG
tara:strand:+ start:2792 stop:2959 length:168 start_codon:yes stop_codon:yes gene_type:complete